jgi:ribosomal protein S18 acetylase RimI-like enzyme
VSGLRTLSTHAELLEATGGDPFVRYDLPDPLEHPAWCLGDAVAVPRRTHTRRLGLLVMGPGADCAALVGRLVGEARLPELGGFTVARHAFPFLAERLPQGEDNEWEWMRAASPPPVVAAETRLVRLSRNDLEAIRRLLALGNPGTDARPFEFPGQQWVGARDEAGTLVACGVREPNLAGWPILSGITVHPAHRGTGLGLAVTAHLTRAAVHDTGVCTLGLYSHNDVARRVYHGLGYGGDHLWTSRRLAPRH